MIPDDEYLERFYERSEIDTLRHARLLLDQVSDDRRRNELGRELIRKLWPDWLERLQKTSLIQPKEGPPCLLILRPAQLKFMQDVIVRCIREGRPIRGIILKARQLGFSTLIQCLYYFWLNERPDLNSFTVSYDDASTVEMFQKAHYLQKTAWFPRRTQRERNNIIHFEHPHSSKFVTGTAGNDNVGRSFTNHFLHCSEIPMWEDAETVLVGLQQSVPETAISCNLWESTAKGALGPFYEQWTRAEEGKSNFIPFFAPWHMEGRYSKPFPSKDHLNRFMRKLSHRDREYQARHRLKPEQMHWRAAKIDDDFIGNERSFRQEYPADAEEAFLTSGSPAFDPDAVRALADNVAPAQWIGDAMMQRTDL